MGSSGAEVAGAGAASDVVSTAYCAFSVPDMACAVSAAACAGLTAASGAPITARASGPTPEPSLSPSSGMGFTGASWTATSRLIGGAAVWAKAGAASAVVPARARPSQCKRMDMLLLPGGRPSSKPPVRLGTGAPIARIRMSPDG